MTARPPWRRALPFAALAAVTTLVFADGLTGAFTLDGRAPSGAALLGWHATSLLLHGLCVLAAFVLFRRLLGARPGGTGEPPRAVPQAAVELGALAGALLFAVHPVQADSVTDLAGRRELLHGALFLGGLLAYLRFRDTGRRAWAVLLLPLYGLALALGETALALPAALLLLDAALERLERSAAAASPAPRAPPARRTVAGVLAAAVRACGRSLAAYVRPLRRRPWLFGTLCAAGLALLLYRVAAGPAPHVSGWWGGSRTADAASALGTLPGYARLVLWPVVLLVDYSPDAYPVQTGFAAALPLGGLALLAVLAGVALGLLDRAPRLALAAGWILVTLPSVLPLVPHEELLAEHCLYLPLLGVALAAGAGLAQLRRRSRPAASVLLVVLLVPLAVRTAVRNRDFADDGSAWRAELDATDDCARAHAEYAALLWDHPERDAPDRRGLARHLERALEIQDRSAAGVVRFAYDETAARLGAVEVRRGRTAAGLALLRDAWRRMLARGEQRGQPGIAPAYVATLLDLGGAGRDEASRTLLREAEAVATQWLTWAADPARVHLLRGRARQALCALQAARDDYDAVGRGADDPAARAEAAERTVESWREAGDIDHAALALVAFRTQGVRSPGLDALQRTLASGMRPPAPRCGGRER